MITGVGNDNQGQQLLPTTLEARTVARTVFFIRKLYYVVSKMCINVQILRAEATDSQQQMHTHAHMPCFCALLVRSATVRQQPLHEAIGKT